MTKYTKDQIELKSYIEKMNSDTQFKTTTDLNHWADYGIFNVTDYEKYMVALARQRRMGMKKNENVIPFPKQD